MWHLRLYLNFGERWVYICSDHLVIEHKSPWRTKIPRYFWLQCPVTSHRHQPLEWTEVKKGRTPKSRKRTLQRQRSSGAVTRKTCVRGRGDVCPTKRLPLKHRELSCSTRIHVEKAGCSGVYLWFQHGGGRERQNPGAYWSSSLDGLVSSRTVREFVESHCWLST